MTTTKNTGESELSRTIKAFLFIMLSSSMIAVAIGLIWIEFEGTIRLPNILDNVLNLSISAFGSFFTGLVVFAFYKTIGQNCELNAFAEANLETFERYKKAVTNPTENCIITPELIEEVKVIRREYKKIFHSRLRTSFHLVMVPLSGIVLVSNMTKGYESPLAGFLWISLLVFAMAFAFGYTKVFGDPINGPIKLKNISLRWLTDTLQ